MLLKEEAATEKFREQDLCRSLFFKKFAGLRPATLLKSKFSTDVFL